ncbi:hypothetical protein GUJ93_ZPchr0007g3859 [Zizania palustris]|uniref:Uncharacterized protein n=1 Tax=Zizania palustris TaxID=103762 RepID=A0A8J5T2M7_ZIZPA|nr:hypothetical protein GUJ93_ZPchr0007g3859 [Zizania palustris]
MRKLGIIKEDEEAYPEALKRYVDLFDHPLSSQHVHALAELLEVDISQQPLLPLVESSANSMVAEPVLSPA